MADSKDGGENRAHQVDIHVGMRVRQRRKALKLSQSHLAQSLGLTFQQVQKYERGANRISASKLFEIAQVFGTPIAWFFEGDLSGGLGLGPQPGGDVHAFLQTHEALDLSQAFLAIQSREQRDRILDLIHAMGPSA